MIKYKVRFKGLNLNWGYKPGWYYAIVITGNSIQELDGSLKAHFPSLESFFNNFDILEQL